MDQDLVTKQLGELLERQRRKKNMTIYDLADAAGVGHSTIWSVENGQRNMTLHIFFALCAGLGTEAWEILRDATSIGDDNGES